MAGILAANNHYFAVTANNLAFVAHGFYGRSYFHDCSFFEFRNRNSEFGIGCRLIKFSSCSQFDCESYCRSVSYANKAASASGSRDFCADASQTKQARTSRESVEPPT